MNTSLMIVFAVVLLLAAMASFKRFPRLMFKIGLLRFALANDGALTVGIHAGGRVSGYCDSAPTTTRFLAMKQGNADNHYTVVTSVLDMPVAICTDEPAATTDQVNFQLLNANDSTVRMVAAGAIAAGAPVVTNGDGTVKALPATAGVYWQLGVAVTSAVLVGDLIEVQPCIQQIGVSLIT